MTPNAQGLVDIGKMILQFAKVNRATLHEDGIRPESDTDHTVMLSVSACAIADALYKERLDIGKVAQFAIVHDLVEVYANDTDTFNITEDLREEKYKREKESFLRVKSEFKDIYPWIHQTIEEYDTLDTPEARFIKTLDKAMPKVTNILNHGAYLSSHNRSQEDSEYFFKEQLKTYGEKYGKEFPELMAILKELMETMIKNIYK